MLIEKLTIFSSKNLRERRQMRKRDP